MVERAWKQEADLTDDQSVRRVLVRYARQGCDFERDHQILGASISGAVVSAPSDRSQDR
ncbi:hypothetical protein ACJBCE_36275 [Streptomyces sp. NBUL23]|uniref:hypothetical protein n=1 Tax=Streptomyces sp. NBUL23 TaxID=3381354 RepID=UPI0038713625